MPFLNGLVTGGSMNFVRMRLSFQRAIFDIPDTRILRKLEEFLIKFVRARNIFAPCFEARGVLLCSILNNSFLASSDLSGLR